MTSLHRLALAAALLVAPSPAFAQEPPAPPPAPGGEKLKPEEDPKAKKAAEEAAKADAAVLEGLVQKAMPIVEKLRGGKFAKAIEVQPVTRKDFLDRYYADLTRVLGGEERLAATSRLLGRLGVIEPGTDLRALLGSFLEGNIAANYDPATKKISFLPGVARTVQLMVHELTHALDDQNFDMNAQIKGWNGSFDRALAYGALAEGDAESIEYRLASGGATAAQPLEKLREVADDLAAQIMSRKFGVTPPAIVLAFQSQYIEGLVFAEAVRRSPKKNEAMDEAFRTPPASTEHILHPEKFLEGKDPPVTLVLPRAPEGAKVLVSTTLGELGTRIVLLAKGMSTRDATASAEGWGGDTAALVAFPSGEALVWVSTWDTERDASLFYESMKGCFPVKTGEESAKATRLCVLRGSTVEFIEAPLDALPDAVAMARKAERR